MKITVGGKSIKPKVKHRIEIEIDENGKEEIYVTTDYIIEINTKDTNIVDGKFVEQKLLKGKNE